MLPNKVFPFILLFVRKFKYRFIFSALPHIIDNVFAIIGGSYVYGLLASEANAGTLTMNKGIIYIVIFTYTVVSWCFIMFLSKNIQTSWESSLEYNLNITMFTNTLKHELDYFNNHLSGSLTNKIQNILKNINNISQYGFFIINNNIAFFIGLIMLNSASYKLTIASIIWYICFHITLIPFLKKEKENSKKTSEEKSKSIGIINDCFVNIINIKIFSRERKEYRTIKKQSSNILRSEIHLINSKSITETISYIFTSSYIFITNYIALTSYFKKEIDIGTMLFILSFSMLVCFWINWEITCLTRIIDSVGETQSSLNTLNEPIKINDKDGAKKLKNIDGKIMFKNINFGYSNEK